MGLIFSSLVNKYIVDKFLASLTRNRSMVSPTLKNWRSEKFDNLTQDSSFAKTKFVPRHEKEFKKVLDKYTK